MLIVSKFSIYIILLGFLALSSGSVYGASSAPLSTGPSDCEHSAAGNEIYSEPDLAKKFLQSKSLVLLDERPRTVEQVKNGHLVSNEFDIFRLPLKLPQRDFFTGIGNNASWDLALRTGAKKILFFDHNIEPLILQRYFFRPLFEISRSPAEFFSFVTLSPISNSMIHASLKDISDFSEALDARVSRMLPEELNEFKRVDQASVAKTIISRLKKNSKDPEIKTCIEVIEAIHHSHFEETPGPMPLSVDNSLNEISRNFQLRYLPSYTRKFYNLSDKESKSLLDPRYSFMSNLKNFQMLQRLVLDAMYAVAPVTSDIWDQLSKHLIKTQWNGITIFISNILETNNSPKHLDSNIQQSIDFLKETFRPMPASPVLVLTKGTSNAIHSFTVLRLSEPIEDLSLPPTE